MDVLFPSRAGVVNEGNKGNKHPLRAAVFPLFPPFLGYARGGNRPPATRDLRPVFLNLHARKERTNG